MGVKSKKGKKFDRKKYEERAKERIRQQTRVNKNVGAPSGYLTPAASRLIPGNGLMDYVYTDKLKEGGRNGDGEDRECSDGGSESASKDSASSKRAKNTAANTTANTSSASSEDGFLGFEDNDADDAPIANSLADQFASFENQIKAEAEQIKQKELKKQEEALKLPSHHPAPWNNNCSSKDSMPKKLSREIKNYVSYMSPTIREVKDRRELVLRIQSAVTSMLSGKADCKLFGSSATDMYLPQADVDMVLINNGGMYKERSVLYQLKAYFLRKGWTSDALVVARARVPIIKFTDSKTKLNVDISIGQSGGVEAIKVVEEWVKRQPALKPLVVIVKQFLKRRNLSEVFHGGLGGFATICLVMSFLENHEKLKAGEIIAMENLGILLYELFEFYGKQFQSRKYALRMTGKMPRVLKSISGNLQTQKPEQISVEDPNDYTNNITRSSYNWVNVQKEFSHGADLLKRMMVEYGGKDDSTAVSFLGPLLKNNLDKDRHSIEVMRDKVESLTALATSGGNSKSKKKEKRKEKAKKKAERNKKAKQPTSDDENKPTKAKRKRSIVDLTVPTDDTNPGSVVDLTLDTPSPKRSAITEVFQASLSSDNSDVEVTAVKSAQSTPSSALAAANSSEDEVSRTKIAGPGATERKRAYWAKKNGLEV